MKNLYKVTAITALIIFSFSALSCNKDKEVAKRYTMPKNSTQNFDPTLTSDLTDTTSSTTTQSQAIEGLNLYIDAVTILYNEKVSDNSYKDYAQAHVCAANIGTGTIGKVTPTITIAINNITKTIPAFTFDLTNTTLKCMTFNQGLELFKVEAGKDYTVVAKVASTSENPALNDNDKIKDFFYEPIDMATQKVTTNANLYVKKAEKSYGIPTNGSAQTDILLVEVCLDGGNLITKNGNSDYAYTSVDATLNDLLSSIAIGFNLNLNHECTAIKYALSEFNAQKGNTYSGDINLRPNTDVNWNESTLEDNKYSINITY
jgi:hypothetical protein